MRVWIENPSQQHTPEGGLPAHSPNIQPPVASADSTMWSPEMYSRLQQTTLQLASRFQFEISNRLIRRSEMRSNDPLHGLTLETIVTRLHEHYGWEGLSERISINCFSNDPSINSSLKFLRRTPWARAKIEKLYVAAFADKPS
jgi:hypothetical protein